MNKNVNYAISGKHGSIENLRWNDVPSFAILTGENGAGKTHLLEAIASGYGHQPVSPQNHPRRGMMQRPLEVKVTLDEQPIQAGRVFYAGADWMPPNWGIATLDQVTSEAHRLYGMGATECMKDAKDPLYSDWIILKIQEAPSVTHQKFVPPSWDLFESKLTHWRLAANNQSQNLAYLFLAFEVLRVAARERCQRTGEDLTMALSQLGEPPWEIFNRLCREADLKFEVLPPTIERRSILASPVDPYRLMIRDIERDIVVSESDASSGERIMLSIVAWRFLAEATGDHYDVILLDEPDAHLHPSLVRQFLRVLETVMVKRHRARVILTTHSPSTVALAPEGSVFELRRHGEPRIEAVANASTVIAKLTDGLVAVDAATRFVVLEGVTDRPFFERLWTLLVEEGLSNFPGISFFTRDGCTKVRDTVRYLREWDFTRFYGVLDRDTPPNQNEAEDGIFILERNGVENYLFDPLNVWLCLWMHKPALHTAHLHQISEIRSGNGHRLKSMSTDDLQAAADSVIAHVRKELEEIDDADEQLVDANYMGGLSLRYPRWVFDHDDHKLAAAVRKSFAPYPIPDRDLRESFMTMSLISQDLWDIFEQITKHP